MAFAIDIVDDDDPYLKLANQMNSIGSNLGNPGNSVVDIAPWGELNPAMSVDGKFVLMRLILQSSTSQVGLAS